MRDLIPPATPGEYRDFPVARESWFNGYLKGNMVLPQSFFGIRLYLMNALLSSRPDKWEDFEDSVLGEDQVEKVTRAGMGAHKKKNIGLVITQDNIEALWTKAKSAVAQDLKYVFCLGQQLGDDINFIEALNSKEAKQIKEITDKVINLYSTDTDLKKMVGEYHDIFSTGNNHDTERIYQTLIKIFRYIREKLLALELEYLDEISAAILKIYLPITPEDIYRPKNI